MVNDDDVMWAALLAPSPTTFFGGLVLLTVLVCLALAAWSNDRECASCSCATGHAVLLKHECVCLTTTDGPGPLIQ